MSTLVVAEKPSVARDLARVLGADRRRTGYLEGPELVITWAVGHLVGLPQPHEIEPAWKAWARASLPMLPTRFPLVVLEDGRAQFEVVRRLLLDPRFTRVVCATDAGREGELIFRYIAECAGFERPHQRLWISSLTDEAIRAGFARLKPASEYDALADAARARSRADWLVGMNLSRLYSLGSPDLLSVGRVQTPTLAMVVDRDLAIEAFVPEPYVELELELTQGTGPFFATYHAFEGAVRGKDGKVRMPKTEKARLPLDRALATRILERVERAELHLEVVDRSEKRTLPPLLYDLTELQRDANRVFGFSAKHTLDLAQALYERHKVLSYPRTDSRHVTEDVRATLPPIVAGLAPRYAAALGGVQPSDRLPDRYVDEARVADHHAILPTGRAPGALSADEEKVYDLVCRRVLAAHLPPKIEAVTAVIARADGKGGDEASVDRFFAKGVALESKGFSCLDRKARSGEPEPDLPPGLREGRPVARTSSRIVEKKTNPPKPYTEATLLTAMESAGRTLESKELASAMRESGLGTPATRAATIETLLQRTYLVRDGKAVRSTPLGRRLVESVHPAVRSPAMTGQWELRLARMERGEEPLGGFLADIHAYVREVVGSAPPRPAASASRAPEGAAPASSGPSAAEVTRPARSRREPAASSPETPGGSVGVPDVAPSPPRPSPRAAEGLRAPITDLVGLLRARFGFASFRPHQEDICRTVAGGRSALVVMPTGAGKSLCYQLPGYARGGTTLVVCPLIALIEDQVGKLRAAGFAAERIHSGMDRSASRAVCVAYLEGTLDYLFIAPERLGVPGFPEMLARRPPTLVAVDEAHCISQWGHDFRPDYRLLHGRLAAFGEVPILALTATATPRVQTDILVQLGMPSADRFIFGFRRTNLAVEVVDAGRADRGAVVRDLLSDAARRPAIVYASTRKDAESIADALPARLRAAAYHAGMTPEARADVQQRFLEGSLEVMVATIAFGMGIDKPDVRTVVHAALPGSVEGYYQEIGRAGRDGRQSRAVLLHAAKDRRTQTFFVDRDYPELSVVDALEKALAKGPRAMERLPKATGETREVVERAVERLRQLGGVHVDAEGDVSWLRGPARAAYEAQRAHRLAQLDAMAAFVSARGCRMRALVSHFGDAEDDGRACGLCDACAPDAVLVASSRVASEHELALLEDVLAELGDEGERSAGKLYEAVAEGRMKRPEFEALLTSAERVGVVELEARIFHRDGRDIPYRVVRPGPRADEPLDALASELSMTSLDGYSKPSARAGRGKARRPASDKATGRAPKRRASAGSREDGFESLDSRVVDALRSFRMREAKAKGVPPFVIFTDKTMHAIATASPRTLDELRGTGLGAKKLSGFGDALLEALDALRDG